MKADEAAELMDRDRETDKFKTRAAAKPAPARVAQVEEVA